MLLLKGSASEEVKEELEYDDESDDENLESKEIPKEVRILRTQSYDKAVIDLVEMMRKKDIILDPDYQRNYIWDNKRASLLIESILLNVPIPVIYVAEDEENRWVVVDGLQRLYSILRFFNNEFKLSGLEILSDLQRSQYSKLNPKALRILNNGIFRVIVIKEESNQEIKYDIFQRLNRGSVKLNEQELRNCIYRGPLSNLLKELCEYPSFLKAIGLKRPDKRFFDSELILRFLALNSCYDPNTGKVNRYPNRMKTFLNDYMRENRKINSKDSEQIRIMFKSTIDKVISVFDTPSFRRFKAEDGTYDTRLNRALMDVIMVSFSKLSSEFLNEHRNQITELLKSKITSDTSFNEALIYGTSDTRKLEYRLNSWNKSISLL